MPMCANCGSELRREWKFCVMCGTHVAPEDGTLGIDLSRPGMAVAGAVTALGAAVLAGAAALVLALV